MTFEIGNLSIIALAVDPTFALHETIAPVAWGRGRWPNHDWINDQLITVAADETGPVIRFITQNAHHLQIATNRPERDHHAWAVRTLGIERTPVVADEPIIRTLARRFRGMRPWSNSSLVESIVTAIVGQSISVQAAAVTERKLCALFAESITIGDREFWPFPNTTQLAEASPELVRLSGVTQKRADAIVWIAKHAAAGDLISEPDLLAGEDSGIRALMTLPMVGRWTAESILLWGFGLDDAHPTGDVALLRAAKLAYDRPEMTLKDLDILAETWQPGRSWAARWLWLGLFGPAPHGRIAS